jgi:hypothetical protein
LLEELPSDQSSFSEESDSSGTDDLTVGEVIAAEFCDDESDIHFSSALSAIFTWEDMTNYVGQREQFVDNYGPQNIALNETHSAKVFKIFFYDELVELIVRETNTQHKKYKPEVLFHCVPECGTGNRSLQMKCVLC